MATKKGITREQLDDLKAGRRAMISAQHRLILGMHDGIGVVDSRGRELLQFHFEQILRVLDDERREFGVADREKFVASIVRVLHDDNGNRVWNQRASEGHRGPHDRFQRLISDWAYPSNKTKRAALKSLRAEVEDLYRPGPAPAGEG
jgi:hypothetical protein